MERYLSLILNELITNLQNLLHMDSIKIALTIILNHLNHHVKLFGYQVEDVGHKLKFDIGDYQHQNIILYTPESKVIILIRINEVVSQDNINSLIEIHNDMARLHAN